MSSIIKHNRINQLGTIQLGEPKNQEMVTINANKKHEISNVHKDQYDKLIREALEIKQKAEKDAINIVEQAKEEANNILKDARLQEQELKEAAYAQIEVATKTLEDDKQAILTMAYQEKEAIRQETIVEKQKILEQIEPEMVSIIKSLLTRVIDKQVIGNGQWLEWIVRKMISTENMNEAITVYISENCYEAYSNMLESQLGDFKYPLSIEMDRTLNDSSCAVETTTGSIYYDVREGLEGVLKELDMLQSLSK